MALLFIDGYDHYTTSFIPSKYSSNNSVSINTTGGRNGGGALFSTNENNYVAIAASPSGSSWFIWGAAVNFANVTGTNTGTDFFQVWDGSATNSSVQQTALGLLSNGSLRIRKGDGTVLGTSASNVIVPNVWYYIEWKCKITTSTGSNECVVRVNGVEVLNLTGVNTNRTASGVWSQARWNSNGGSANALYDDVYLCNSTGTVNNDFLGDVRVIALYPNGNGDFSDYTNSASNSTNNYSYVNEASAPDSDSSYVRSVTYGNQDLYTFTTLSASSVCGIQPCYYMRKDNSGFKNVQIIEKVSGTVYTNSTIALSDTYKYYTQIIELNPATTAAWTVSDINATQFGIKTVP